MDALRALVARQRAAIDQEWAQVRAIGEQSNPLAIVQTYAKLGRATGAGGADVIRSMSDDEIVVVAGFAWMAMREMMLSAAASGLDDAGSEA